MNGGLNRYQGPMVGVGSGLTASSMYSAQTDFGENVNGKINGQAPLMDVNDIIGGDGGNGGKVNVNGNVVDENALNQLSQRHLQTQEKRLKNLDKVENSNVKKLNARMPSSWKRDGIKIDESEIIDINASDIRPKNWHQTYEIDDIMKRERKMISTKRYNPETGKVETINKFTKNQLRKHQINTLAYEAQEMELKMAMNKSAQYKTKAETQAKYGW